MSEDGIKASIFRKAALDRLSSPESLDALMQVITPQSWLMVTPLVVLTGFAVIWSVVGTLPDKVQSPQCILLNPTGLSSVVADNAGRLTRVMVKVGDQLKVGDPIAQVALPEMEDAAQKMEARLKELQARAQVLQKFGSESNVLSDQMIEQQRHLLTAQIASSRQRITNAHDRVVALEERVKVQAELYQRGLVTQSTLLATRQELAASREGEVAEKLQLDAYQGQFDQLKLSSLERRRSTSAQREEIQAQIAEAQRELDSMKNRMGWVSTLKSPYAGKVVEISAANGSLLSPGVPVATIELDNAVNLPLEAVIFPGISDGRKIDPDMVAQIVPSTVKRQEFGYITGKVTFVADYPASPQGMMRILQNENLARSLGGGDPPLAVHVKLDTANSPSGFKWSASNGPKHKLSSGTLCSAEIVTKTQRPIELVIPAIRGAFSL